MNDQRKERDLAQPMSAIHGRAVPSRPQTGVVLCKLAKDCPSFSVWPNIKSLLAFPVQGPENLPARLDRNAKLANNPAETVRRRANLGKTR